jgi:3-dehydroquinate dehydratase/shikimate dehydrogenase
VPASGNFVTPRLCLSLHGTGGAICERIRHHERLVDLFEIRVDLSREVDFAQIRRATARPLLFTGHDPDTLFPALPFADFLDPGPEPGQLPVDKLLLSMHSAGGEPEQIWERLQRGNHLTKIVFDTADYSLISRLLKTGKEHSPRALCFAMGETGAFSRVLAGFRGAPWIYTSPEGAPTAAGQFPINRLLQEYRIRRFKSPPLIFGILGDPVAHSRSPRFHNERFAAEGLPWIYLPFPCRDPGGLFAHAVDFGIHGFSITHPHKRTILNMLQHPTPETTRTRACNTVCRMGDGWHGTNTDVDGARELLAEAAPRGRILILGAGGAARAAVDALRGRGAECVILNRAPENAAELATGCGARSGSLQDFGKWDYDVLVNTTSCGMQEGECPVDPSRLLPGRTVVDVIYEPAETTLLKQARDRGCRTLNGEKWFAAQAEAQFRWWRRLLSS